MVIIFLLVLWTKNLLYYFLSKSLKKLLFIFLGYVVLVASLYISVKLLQFETKGISAVIFNIDFLIVFFIIIFRMFSKGIDFINKNLFKNNLINPLTFFWNFNLRWSYFYITITLIQSIILILIYKANNYTF